MATNEFQARALFDFVAERPTELSFNTGEILLITSTTVGHEWWYAQNSAGQCGAIPANYVETMYTMPETSSFPDPYSYPQSEPSNKQLPLEGNDETQMQQSYMPEVLYENSWLPTEPVSMLSNQVTQRNEQKITPSSSFDSFEPRAMSENFSNLQSGTENLYESYMPVIDPSLSQESAPSSVINPLAMQTTLSNQDSLFDEYYTQPSTDAVPSNSQPSYDLLSPYGYQQPVTSQQQHNPFAEIFTFPSAPTNDYVFNTQPLSTAIETTTTQSAPPADNLISLASPVTPTPAKAKADHTLTLPLAKTKSEKTRFFTLRRLKSKPESENRRSSVIETAPESLATQEPKDESDSDDPTDQNTASSSNKQSVPGGDAKSPPRARFFDKHGIDNYILHGCKVKAEEHVEISYDESQGGVCWSPNPNTPPFTCKVEEPQKGTKLGGLKSFMEYKIHVQTPGGRTVGRRYKQFDWLHEQLVIKFRFICVPPLPGKQIAGRFDQEFVEERRRQLELWLNRICHHPVLCASFPVQHFVTCELTEKNNKDWKAGKRKIEKDELREALWLHCVTFTNSNLTDAQIGTRIDTFAQQQPGFEIHLRNLSQGLSKYVERHTEIYERDMQRLGELFAKLYTAVQIDTTTTGNKEFSNSLSKISGSYNIIAELYKTKSNDGVRDFNERIQDYIGLLACFPMILSIQRSSAEFIKSVQQRGPTTIPDFSNVINRSQVLNHVVLAEINFFQKEKIHDFTLYLKTLLNEQIQFYENITAELRTTAETFN